MVLKLSDFTASCDSVAQATSFAVAALSDGDTLELSGGIIDIFPDKAFKKYYCISNNDRGEKSIAFPIIGKNNITLDGKGAQLVFHGNILPFVIDSCTNVTIKNLSIEYDYPRYAEAEIIEADEKKTVVRFDGKQFNCRVNYGKLTFFGEKGGDEYTAARPLCLEFEKATRAPSAFAPTYFACMEKPKSNGFLARMYRDVTAKELAENVIEFSGELGFVHTVGNYLVYTYCGRAFPGIFVTDSKDVFLENIMLYRTTAMGVICQLSENITLDKVCATVKEDSENMVCVNADATHFVNCRGKITMRDCKFVNMMDDACNVHGIYLKDPKKDGKTLSVRDSDILSRWVSIFSAPETKFL